MTLRKMQLLGMNIKSNGCGYKEKILKNVNFEKGKVSVSQETNKAACSALIQCSHTVNEIVYGLSKQRLNDLKIIIIH